MSSITLKTMDNGTTMLSPETVAGLRGKLRGTVALAGEDGYETARTIWNATVDRRPGLVVRCLGAADVIEAVKLARDHKLLVAVRGGGHNIAGNAVCDGGLLIDLSPMKSVRVDPAARTARVEPGATLADFDKEAQSFALATPLGINSTTGVAGLTLGGGFGWTTRKLGLTIDNLLSADVVTAEGKLVRASDSENQDLFWALRGGGGNFGVVTSFEFRLHQIGPEVLSGLIVHPLEKAGELLPGFRRIAMEAPDELTTWVVMRKAPPLPFLPAEWHGKEVLIFAACYCGDMKEGEKAVAALRALGQADRGCRVAASLHRLAGRVRPAADARRAQLLEEPRLHRSPGRGDRRASRLHLAAADPRVRGVHRPRRRRHGECGGRCHRLAQPRRPLHYERAHPLAGQGAGRSLHQVGPPAVRCHGALRLRERLRQLHAR